MKRSDIKQLPEYFAYYVNLIDDVELSEAFEKSLKQIDDLDIAKLNRIGRRVYADGKWSVNKINTFRQLGISPIGNTFGAIERFFLHAVKVQFPKLTTKILWRRIQMPMSCR